MNTQIHPSIIFIFYKKWFLRSAFCSIWGHHNPCAFYSPANVHNETLFFLHFIGLEIIWSVLSSYITQNHTFHHVNKSSSMTFTLCNINILLRTLLVPNFEDLQVFYPMLELPRGSRAQSRDWSAVWDIKKRSCYLITTKSPYYFVRGVRAKFEFRYWKSLKSKFSLILFAYNLMIGWSKQNIENYPSKCFWSKQKITCENIRLFTARRHNEKITRLSRRRDVRIVLLKIKVRLFRNTAAIHFFLILLCLIYICFVFIFVMFVEPWKSVLPSWGVHLWGHWFVWLFCGQQAKNSVTAGIFLPNLESVENACMYDLITSADVKDTASYSW